MECGIHVETEAGNLHSRDLVLGHFNRPVQQEPSEGTGENFKTGKVKKQGFGKQGAGLEDF